VPTPWEKHKALAQTQPDSTGGPWTKHAMTAQPVQPPPQQPQQPQAQSPSLMDSADKFGHNIINSGIDALEGGINLLAHPIDAATNLGKMFIGAAQSIPDISMIAGVPHLGTSNTPEPTEEKEAFGRLVDYLKNYSSIDAIKNKAFNDPVGTALDVSSVIGGVGKLLEMGGLNGASIVSEMANVAQIPSKIGEGAAWATGKLGKEVLGAATGKGAAPIEEAFRIGEDLPNTARRGAFKDNMLNKVPKRDVVNSGLDALSSMEDEMKANYEQSMNANLQKYSNTPVDITPLKQELLKKLNDNGVKVRVTQQGKVNGLNFSRSPLDGIPKENKLALKELVAKINEWGDQPGDLTPMGVNTLRRTIDTYFKSNLISRNIVGDLSSQANRIIESVAPEVTQMNSEYSNSLSNISEARKALSLREAGGRAANPEAALGNMSKALGGKRPIAQEMLQRLDKQSGGNIQATVSGQNLSDILPQSGMSRALLAGEGFSAIHNPELIPFMALSSPRVAGGLAYGLGNLSGAAKAVTTNFPQALLNALQAGRANSGTEKRKRKTGDDR